MNCKIIRPGRLTSASKPLETVRTIDEAAALSIQGQLTSVAAAGVEEGVHDKDRPSPHVYGFC